MKQALLLTMLLSMGIAPTVSATSPVLVSTGDLIKASGDAVYYLASNGKRYVFPTAGTYLSWYADFQSVKTVSDATLASYTIGGNATYKPGVKLLKITTDPKVYAVDANGVLRWVTDERVAQGIYGSEWNKNVVDVPDPFFVNYNIGAPITNANDFKPTDLQTSILSLGENIGLDQNVIRRFTKTDTGKDADLTTPSRFAIILTNPGDGGYLFDEPAFPKNLLVLENAYDVKNPIGTPGDFGKRVWIFRTRTGGSGDVTITIAQPWDASSRKTEFNIKINIGYNVLTPSTH
jgi:predicted secreted protein